MSGETIYPGTLKRLSEAELNARLAAGPQEAARWVYAAAVNGHVQAQVIWGQMLLDGTGTAADPAAALRWFRIAACAGEMDGVNMVGRCFDLGWGVNADPAQAAQWYRIAADKGHGFAQFNLAMLMVNGRGVPYDDRGALALFVRAARQGNAKAMNMIGRLREAGVGTRASRESALRWYRRAAQGGCFRGRYHLGRLLVRDGNDREAARWFAASIEIAPADFCREAAAMLLASPHQAIQDIGHRALGRAAALQLAAQPAHAKPSLRRRGWLRQARRTLRWLSMIVGGGRRVSKAL